MINKVIMKNNDKLISNFACFQFFFASDGLLSFGTI